MPLTNGTQPLYILDNLDEFAAKVLGQIADESAAGSQHLISLIENAQKHYNEPIGAHVVGWVYYFSRTRGPEVAEALEHLKAFPAPIARLQEFKSLLAKGKWNTGSFNNCLFSELIQGVPGYKPLDSESMPLVIRRLRDLLTNKIDEFINAEQATRCRIDEREKSKQVIKEQPQKSLDHVVLGSEWIAAQHAGESQSNKVSFCLVNRTQWQLSWFDFSGTMFLLPLNTELRALLDAHHVVEVENLSPAVIKRIKNECLKIRELFFEKTHILINPKNSKTGLDLNEQELINQGITASFVLHGAPKAYRLFWINALGRSTEISLDLYPQLSKWLDGQKTLDAEQMPQFKAYLTQVSTSVSIGMDAFKSKLERCLLHQKEVPVSEEANKDSKAHRLDLTLFTELERCIGMQVKAHKSEHSSASESEITKPKVQKGKAPNRLDLTKYSAIASIFAHQEDEEEEPYELTNENMVGV